MKAENLRLLYFGQATWGSTSLQRYSALEKMFHTCYLVDFRRVFADKNSGRTIFNSVQGRIGFGPLISLATKILMSEADRFRPDVIWVDGGFLLSKSAIILIKKKYKCRVVHYTPDSLTAPGTSNRCMANAIGVYDDVVTTKEQDFAIYKKLGARNVIFSFQGYDPAIHRPVKLLPQEKGDFSCDVSFVGQYMKDRAASMLYLLENLDIQLSIYGTGWNDQLVPAKLKVLFRGPAVADDYAKVVSGSKIILGFLNNKVKDTFTTRTFEIPACRGFLLAERTPMHENLLTEGVDAEFFSNQEELLDKVNYYLEHSKARDKISQSGYARITASGFSWAELMNKIIAEL